MSSEKQALEHVVTLAEFDEVFADFLGGNVSLAQMRQCLLDVIASDADALPKVQAQIDAAMYSGRLPEQTWENLIAEIDHLVSENTPTEWSDDAEIIADKDEEPLLSFDNEGPMLFDEELVEPPVLVEPVLVETQAQTPAQREPVVAHAPSPPPVPQEKHSEVSASTESTQPMPAESKHDLPPGTVLEDRFVLVSKIESGSMGTVYKALDQQRKDAGAEDPWVAIKLITADFSSHSAAADALKNEAKIGCQLRHPNIVCTHALHEDGEHVFISMEWLDGESLSQLLDRKRPNTIAREQALNIIEQLALGLAHAHAQGVVHADIKPGNVYITQAGEIKLLDFGIARHADDMPAANGLLARTPAYASCEVLEGGDTASQDDLFSLAAVAYRVLAGKRPFGSANALEAESEQREPVPVPGLAPQQWRALRAALAWRREERSADVQSFITEFFGEEEIVLSTPEPVSLAKPASPVPKAAAPESEAVINEAPQPPVIPAEVTAADSAAESLNIDTLDEDEAGGRGWLRAAIAATVVGLAIGGALLFSGGEQPAGEQQLSATSSNPPTLSAEPEGLNMAVASAEAEAAAPRSAPADDGQGPDATLTTAPAGEELMPFMPGTGIAVAEQTAGSGRNKEADRVSDTAQASGEEAEAPASAATGVATAATVAAIAPEPTQPTAGAEPASAATERADSPDAEDKPAAQESAAPTVVAAAGSVAVVAALAQDEATAIEQAVAESPAARDPAQSSNAPAEPERDTVELPSEPLLASTLSLAMVSPDGEPRQAAVEQATVPVPELAVAPEPEDYGPPGEFAPVQIEEVLLSTLKFDRFVEPKFPRRASKRDITGWVDVTFVVASGGKTSEIKVLAAEPGGVFEQAAIEAVERWRFKPRKVDGEAVASRTQIRLRFD